MIAEYERAKIAERYRRGKLFRSRAGEVIAWKAPYGYRRVARAPRGPAHWRSTSPRPPSCAGSSPTASPAATPSGRSAAGWPPTASPHRPASRPGAPPRCRRLLRNEAYVGRVYFNRTETGPRPAAREAQPAGARDPREDWIAIAVPAHHHRRAAFEARRAGQPRQQPVEPAPRRTRPMAAARPGQMRCLPGRHQLPQDARPQRHLAPLLLLPQPRPAPRRRRPTGAAPNATSAPTPSTRSSSTRSAPRCCDPTCSSPANKPSPSRTPAPDDELLAAELARLDRKIDAADAERRRLVDLYQAGLVELPELQRRAAEVEHRRRDLTERRDALTTQRQNSPATTSSAAASATSPAGSSP